MKDFILQNWRMIVEVVSMVVVVIFFFIKKRPVEVQDTLMELIYSRLPEWINKAEEAGKRNCLTGKEKLSLVLAYAKQFFELNGFSTYSHYQAIIIQAVEEFLSTPQKKGE